MGISLLERLVHDSVFDDAYIMLIQQYRLVPQIRMWPGVHDYKSDFRTAASALYQETEGRHATMPLCFCHINGTESSTGLSRRNEDEADEVGEYIEKLLYEGIFTANDIGILSPFKSQVIALRNRLAARYPLIPIETVEKFQGQEKLCILYSCVRSHGGGTGEVLSVGRRLNAAISRAQQQFTIFGDALCLMQADRDGSWCSLLTYIQQENRLLQKHNHQWIPNNSMVR